jgi:hypothetical protein
VVTICTLFARHLGRASTVDYRFARGLYESAIIDRLDKLKRITKFIE